MVLKAWQAPALRSVNEEYLRSRAAKTFGANMWRLAASLCASCPDTPYTCAELGTRIPCRASLLYAMRSDPLNSATGLLAAMMGVLVCAAEANVGGQGCRFLQARRRYRRGKGWQVYCISLECLLNHVEWGEEKRMTLDWEQPRLIDEAEVKAWREKMGLRSGETTLDPATVTLVDEHAPFFYDRSIRDLALFLDLRHFESYVAVVPSDGPCDYESVYAMIKEISMKPPPSSQIYAVRRQGIKLPPPFIKFVAPLYPAPPALSAWWKMAVRLMMYFSKGDATMSQVRTHLDTGLNHVCSAKYATHPIWVDWLMQNPVCWDAIGRGTGAEFRGPIALFREKELQQAQ
jgi:hypothetical protein